MVGSHPIDENGMYERVANVRFGNFKIEHCNTDRNTLAVVSIEPR